MLCGRRVRVELSTGKSRHEKSRYGGPPPRDGDRPYGRDRDRDRGRESPPYRNNRRPDPYADNGHRYGDSRGSDRYSRRSRYSRYSLTVIKAVMTYIVNCWLTLNWFVERFAVIYDLNYLWPMKTFYSLIICSIISLDNHLNQMVLHYFKLTMLIISHLAHSIFRPTLVYRQRVLVVGLTLTLLSADLIICVALRLHPPKHSHTRQVYDQWSQQWSLITWY